MAMSVDWMRQYGNFDVPSFAVDEAEINPQFRRLRLHDIESTQQRRLTVNRRMLALYRQKIAAYFERQIETFCAKRNIEYLRASTVIPFEDLVLQYLRRGFYLH